ncbi:hypothetical protein J6590_079847 [Homalodisca vitripennis]|nr:hypothetical protein J6590_079847 [Homalodisca vitripennis]
MGLRANSRYFMMFMSHSMLNVIKWPNRNKLAAMVPVGLALMSFGLLLGSGYLATEPGVKTLT